MTTPAADPIAQAPITRLAILLWSVRCDDAPRAAAPFVYAATAAAMDAEVEIHFAAESVKLLVPGLAAQIRIGQGPQARALSAFIEDAVSMGAKLLGCSMALAEHLPAQTAWIDGYAGAVGAAAFVRRTLDPTWRTLVF